MEEKKEKAKEFLSRNYHGQLSDGRTAYYISDEDIEELWKILGV